MRFNETYYLIQAGKKTATTRKLKSYEYYKARIGHVCHAQKDDEPDIRIRIKSVTKRLLKNVAEESYQKEGFDSVGAFVDCWLKIYGAYNPIEEVAFIEFERVN